MKKITLIAASFLIAAALLAPVSAQEAPAAPAQAAVSAPSVPAAPANKKTAKPKRAKKAQVKEPAAAPAAVQETVQVSTPAAEVPPAPETAAPAPAPVVEAPKPAPGTLSSCPHCFQPLVAGYKSILADLEPWMEKADVQAAEFDHRLSAIQKQINEKEKAIEEAKLDADRKAVKAAVKALTKEHKQLLKEYGTAADQKETFYKKFSKVIEKKTEGYNKTIESKLRETLSAASQ